MRILGIDIGGSALKGAPVDTRTGRLLAERHRVEIESPCPPAQAAAAAREIARHFRWRGPVGIGFPGVMQRGRVKFLGNLGQEWVGVNAEKLFARATGCGVTVINDADAAGLAEMRFGAGRGHRGRVLLLTAGTGIGSALFHDGRLFPNTEFGHVPVRGRSGEKFFAAAVKTRRHLTWKQWAGGFGGYVRLLERLLWPELIIIGGGVSAKSGKWFKYLRLRTRVVPAKLHNEAGIVGAALAGSGGRR